MKVLFLDDSLQRKQNIIGFGGFVANGAALRRIGDELSAVKKAAGIPVEVELKWSPPSGHFLRTGFTGIREELYRAALSVLARNEAQVICVIHFLDECHGHKLHSWPIQKSVAWAIPEQMRYAAERFHSRCLAETDDWGIIICDEAAARDEDEDRIEEFLVDLELGTPFEQFNRIAMAPIPARSKFSPHLQLADLVTGIVTGAAAGGKHAKNLFNDVALLFLREPEERFLASLLSFVTIGYGLKVFPTDCDKRVRQLFSRIDSEYVVTAQGITRNLRSGTQPQPTADA